MDGSFSERADHVMELAGDEASRLRHEYLGTEHILLGLAGSPAGIAADVLRSFDVSLDRVRVGVEGIVGIGPPEASPDDRGITPRAKTVLDFARQEASQRGVARVEPEHLLLGVTREIHGVAAQVLRGLQAAPETVREKLSGLLG